MAGPWEKYAKPQAEAGPWTKYGNQPAAPVQSQEEGFLERLGEDFDTRRSAMQNARDLYFSGQQTNPEATLQIMGNMAGLGMDTAENVVKSAASAAPDFIKEPIKKAAGYVLTGAGSLPSMGGGTLGEDLPQELAFLGEKYANFQSHHPRATRNVEAAANLGLLLPVPRAAQGAGNLGTAAAKVGQKAVKVGAEAVDSLNTRTILPNSDEIKKAASVAYQRADELGGILKPEFTNNFLQSARQSLMSGDELVDSMKSNKPLADALDDLFVFQNQPMTLQRAQALDEQLGNMIDGFVDANGNMDKAGKKLLDVQSSFRHMIENAEGDLIDGGKEGFEALKEGRKLWSSSRRLADIERIIDNAEMYQVPATAIKTGFRRLAKNAKQLGYSDDEIKAIRSAAETGVIADLMATFGSRLGAIAGGATGGVPGAAIGFGVSSASRAGATAAQAARANKAARLVAERSGMVRTEKRLDPEKLRQIMRLPPKQAQQLMREMDAAVDTPAPQQLLLEAPSPQRALPAPSRDIVVDMDGVARQASPDEQARSILKRQDAEALGMTPDVSRAIDQNLKNELMKRYGGSELGRFVAENPHLPLTRFDEARLRQMVGQLPPREAEEIINLFTKAPQ